MTEIRDLFVVAFLIAVFGSGSAIADPDSRAPMAANAASAQDDVAPQSGKPSTANAPLWAVRRTTTPNQVRWAPATCDKFNDHIVTLAWFADAPTRDRGLESAMHASVAELNEILSAHGIKGYRFDAVDLLKAPFRETLGLSLMVDYRELVEVDQKPFADVRRRAGEARADLVVQVVSYQVSDNDEDGECGYTNDRDHRALVVDLNCMTARRRTLPHEIGHRFGAEHDRGCCPPEGCSGSPPYAYDWRSQDGELGTIMAQWRCGATRLRTRLEHFSDARIPGRGNAATMDVARLLAERLPAIAGLGACSIT